MCRKKELKELSTTAKDDVVVAKRLNLVIIPEEHYRNIGISKIRDWSLKV